jgi:hypothetical protein
MSATHIEPSWADCPRLDLTVYVFRRAIRGLTSELVSYCFLDIIGLVCDGLFNLQENNVTKTIFFSKYFHLALHPFHLSKKFPCTTCM